MVVDIASRSFGVRPELDCPDLVDRDQDWSSRALFGFIRSACRPPSISHRDCQMVAVAAVIAMGKGAGKPGRFSGHRGADAYRGDVVRERWYEAGRSNSSSQPVWLKRHRKPPSKVDPRWPAEAVAARAVSARITVK